MRDAAFGDQSQLAHCQQRQCTLWWIPRLAWRNVECTAERVLRENAQEIGAKSVDEEYSTDLLDSALAHNYWTDKR